MEKDFCNQCGACCKKIAVDFPRKIMYRDGVQELTAEFEKLLVPVSKTNNITFCSCKYLSGRLCTNPQKPEECIKYPSSPFAFIPDDCGYEGDIFIKLESIKQKIRKFKEEILYYKTCPESDKEIKKIIEHHQGFINKYKMYGSDDW